MDEINFTEEEIKKIKEYLDSDEIDSEIIEQIRGKQKELIELKLNSYDNSINRGKLYFKIYNILDEIKDFLKSSEKIKNYIINLKIDKGFERDIEHYNSKNYGSYFAGERIKKFVLEKKEDINTLIDLFFKIFSEEE